MRGVPVGQGALVRLIDPVRRNVEVQVASYGAVMSPSDQTP